MTRFEIRQGNGQKQTRSIHHGKGVCVFAQGRSTTFGDDHFLTVDRDRFDGRFIKEVQKMQQKGETSTKERERHQ